MDKPLIAVIGLGIMGRGIALNYLANDYKVVVWNRTLEKCKELEDAGAVIADSPAHATELSNIVFDVTANDESSRGVFLNPDTGIFTTATPEHTLITCATLSISWTKELAKLCEDRNLTFFDIPMTGSRKGAEGGTLVLMVGGNKEKFETVKQHLDAISAQQSYFGEAGKGMEFKLILNAIQAIQIIGFGQAMQQAEAIGIDLSEAGTFFANIPGGLPTNAAWLAYQNFPEQPNFQVKWILKDLRYAQEMLDEVGYKEVDPSLLKACIAVLQDAFDKGYGDYDWTVVNTLNTDLEVKAI